MKICDDDPFFTVDVPVFRIRPSTPAEAARREQRWCKCRARKLRDRLELAARGTPETEPLAPWRELAAGWRQVLAIFDSLLENDDEEEQARQAYHRGGMCWRAFFAALNQRKRDRAGLVAIRR